MLFFYFSDKEEEIKKEEWQEIAKNELEDWYRNHAEQIAKTKAANRYAYCFTSLLQYLCYFILRSYILNDILI